MNRSCAAAIAAVVLLAGCAAGVRESDLKAWEGQPVAALDTHPFFITVPMVRTITADGTEIRNYVNGGHVRTCAGGGDVDLIRPLSSASYSAFSACMSRFAACNNIFHIRNGRVESYSPLGTGGVGCYTNDQVRPGFRGAANVH